MKENPLKSNETNTHNPSARPNIVLFGLLIWFLFIQRYIVGAYIVNPIIDALNVRPLHWLVDELINVIVAYFPLLVYFLYLIFSKPKQEPMSAFSISRLSLKNVLYITVITAAFTLTYSWIMFGISFLSGHTPEFVMELSLGQFLIRGAILAVLFEEFYFRGLMWNEYRRERVSFWKTAIATGLFFGLIHGGFGIVDTTFSGILLYAPLIYLTRSIWAPILHHALVNSMNPVMLNFLSRQEDMEVFFPTFMIALTVAVAILIPTAIICAKKFWTHNRHNVIKKAELPEESKAFTITFWVLIASMIAAIFLFRL